MSPSGPELLRRIKSQIEEVDPAEVNELAHEGVTIVDVRESDEFADRPPPGAKSVRADTSSRASRASCRTAPPR